MTSAIIGQGDVIRWLLPGLVCGGNRLVSGVSGLARTMLMKTPAGLPGADFRRIQFAPDLMPSDLTGAEILQSHETGRRRDLVFHRGPAFPVALYLRNDKSRRASCATGGDMRPAGH